MATLGFKILPSRRKSSGKLGIYVYLTFKKEVRYISTEFEIDDEYQFDKGKVCYRKDASIMNKRMEYILNEYKDRLSQLNLRNYYNCSELKEALIANKENLNDISISTLFDLRIKYLHEEKRNTYAKMNEYSCNVILSILRDMPIEYLTRSDIRLLDNALIRKGFSNCNRQMRMSHLKAAINWGCENDIIHISENPFRGYRMPVSQARIMDISRRNMIKIINHHSTNNRINFARDIFLLSFYLGGINLADLVDINLSGPTINYTRKKTRNKKMGEKQTVISIQPEARDIINKYINNYGILSFPNKNKVYTNISYYINRSIKMLAAEIGINNKNFSYYSARKTFAQFAFDLGIRTEIIEYCIGQSMKANRPIYNYVRVMQRKADEAIRDVINYTLYSSDI